MLDTRFSILDAGTRRAGRKKKKFTLRSQHFVLNAFGQLLLMADYADYTDLGIRVYKRMRIYLWGAVWNEGLEQAVI